MKNKEFVIEWLKRARSNLERAQAGKISEGILYEDLCFDCQQSAEKAIKALLISLDKKFPPIHSMARLLELVSEVSTTIPEEVKMAIDLTEYAVKTRYPGEREPISEEEYKESLKIAEIVYEWATKIIKEKDK
ncbi:HEPN domain-containing protein [bacterium]|nr:HEPN domain-containing protein [bacterium]MBU1600175.1 HEPN domain-containing protein [bacterium]MBU2461873.1 HEPN domain-containing protein [bacterium]